MKIVSLLPSATEIVYALGAADDLAGVTFECDYPSAARHKPFVSDTTLPVDATLTPVEIDRLVAERVAAGEPLYSLDDELIRGIAPDLVLAQDLCRVCAVPSGQVAEALALIGCDSRVISLDPHTLDDILSGIVAVGDATGRIQRAHEVVRDLRARVARVRARARSLPHPRVLALEWAEPPFVGGHWLPEMIVAAGGVDILGHPGQPSRRVSWPAVERAAPDMIVHMPCGYGLDAAAQEAAHLYDVAPVRRTPAGRDRRLFAVDASSYFSRPGPRIVDGLEALAWLLHPDSFARPSKGMAMRVELPP